MMFRGVGYERGKTKHCEMSAGIQLYLCKTCECKYKGRRSLVVANQVTSLTKGDMRDCGVWFTASSTVIQMLLTTYRSFAVTEYPASKECFAGRGQRRRRMMQRRRRRMQRRRYDKGSDEREEGEEGNDEGKEGSDEGEEGRWHQNDSNIFRKMNLLETH